LGQARSPAAYPDAEKSRKVCRLLVLGWNNERIALALHITPQSLGGIYFSELRYRDEGLLRRDFLAMTLWRQVRACGWCSTLARFGGGTTSAPFSAPPRLHSRARRPAHPLSHAALRIGRLGRSLNRVNKTAFEKNGIAMRHPAPILLVGISQGPANRGNQLEPEALLAKRCSP
jgi:hypothetical protein